MRNGMSSVSRHAAICNRMQHGVQQFVKTVRMPYIEAPKYAHTQVYRGQLMSSRSAYPCTHARMHTARTKFVCVPFSLSAAPQSTRSLLIGMASSVCARARPLRRTSGMCVTGSKSSSDIDTRSVPPPSIFVRVRPLRRRCYR